MMENTYIQQVSIQESEKKGRPTLLKTNQNAPENREGPKKETIVFQPSIFRCELAVSFVRRLIPKAKFRLWLVILLMVSELRQENHHHLGWMVPSTPVNNGINYDISTLKHAKTLSIMGFQLPTSTGFLAAFLVAINSFHGVKLVADSSIAGSPWLSSYTASAATQTPGRNLTAEGGDVVIFSVRKMGDAVGEYAWTWCI